MTFPAGRVAGVPLRIGASWLFLLPFMAVVLFLGIPGDLGPTAARWLVGALGSAALLGSVIAHEAGHVVAARRYDLEVAGLSVFLFGGFSEIRLDAAVPMRRVAVAGAGPVASLGTAGALGALAWAAPEAWGASHVAGLVALVNIAVAGFNLLPGAPLDGGRILAALLVDSGMEDDRADRVAAWLGVVVGSGFVLVGAAAMWLGEASGGLLIPLGTLVLVLGVGGLTAPTHPQVTNHKI
jgi:Zn-dependent protease